MSTIYVLTEMHDNSIDYPDYHQKTVFVFTQLKSSFVSRLRQWSISCQAFEVIKSHKWKTLETINHKHLSSFIIYTISLACRVLHWNVQLTSMIPAMSRNAHCSRLAHFQNRRTVFMRGVVSKYNIKFWLNNPPSSHSIHSFFFCYRFLFRMI